MKSKIDYTNARQFYVPPRRTVNLTMREAAALLENWEEAVCELYRLIDDEMAILGIEGDYDQAMSMSSYCREKLVVLTMIEDAADALAEKFERNLIQDHSAQPSKTRPLGKLA